MINIHFKQLLNRYLFKMKILKYISFILLVGLVSCSDEPEQTDNLSIQPLIQSVCDYDNKEFNAPENPPEYYIINSARDLTNLPKGTLDWHTESVCTKVDFAKKTLIITASVIYCEPTIDDDDWNWAMAEYVLTKDYTLNIRYSNCSVLPNTKYSEKCKILFGFTTEKIPSDTKLTITESMVVIQPK